MARKNASSPSLKVVAPKGKVWTPGELKPFQSRFGGDLSMQLMLYQDFIIQWIRVMTSWADKVAHPLQLMPGPNDIYSQVMRSIQSYSPRLFSLMANRSHQQIQANMLKKHDPVAKVGRAALQREDALTSAFALIEIVLYAVNDCFHFGRVLGGGKNAQKRSAFFASNRVGKYTQPYRDALEALSKTAGFHTVTVSTSKSGKARDGARRNMAERQFEETLRGPMVNALLIHHLGLANNLFMAALETSSAAQTPRSATFLREAPFVLADLDETVAMTEVFLDALPGLTEALRLMDETELADLLKEISGRLQ